MAAGLQRPVLWLSRGVRGPAGDLRPGRALFPALLGSSAPLTLENVSPGQTRVVLRLGSLCGTCFGPAVRWGGEEQSRRESGGVSWLACLFLVSYGAERGRLPQARLTREHPRCVPQEPRPPPRPPGAHAPECLPVSWSSWLDGRGSWADDGHNSVSLTQRPSSSALQWGGQRA